MRQSGQLPLSHEQALLLAHELEHYLFHTTRIEKHSPWRGTTGGYQYMRMYNHNDPASELAIRIETILYFMFEWRLDYLIKPLIMRWNREFVPDFRDEESRILFEYDREAIEYGRQQARKRRRRKAAPAATAPTCPRFTTALSTFKRAATAWACTAAAVNTAAGMGEATGWGSQGSTPVTTTAAPAVAA